MNYAPVILFTYNRPDLVRNTLRSLKENILSQESTLYVFADGPKSNATVEDKNRIEETRKVLREEKWCKEVYIKEAVQNKGLANSVIDGVTEIVNKYGKAIIIEDDVLLSPYFLRFMNDALQVYENDEKVFAIGSWSYFINEESLSNTFFLGYPDSIAWAVFQRSWNYLNLDSRDLQEQLVQSGKMAAFSPFKDKGYFDKMLNNQIEGTIDSWAIRWTATTVLNDGLVLYPPVSLSKHMGNDTGTHEKGNDYNASLKIADQEIPVIRQEIKEDRIAFEQWKSFVTNNFFQKKETSIKQSLKSIIPKRLKIEIKNLIKGTSKITLKKLLDTEPASRVFGFDRGTPIDRYYIDTFLRENKKLIKGTVLEIGDSTYSKKYHTGATAFEIFNFVEDNQATIVGDLTRHESLPENLADCFICTQTFNFIYDYKAAMEGAYKLLKPGGVLLATVAGLCQISQYDNKRWGDFWRFTPASIKKIGSDIFGSDIKVSQYGNSTSAMLLIKGFSAEEVNHELLDKTDEDYPVTITLIAIKPVR